LVGLEVFGDGMDGGGWFGEGGDGGLLLVIGFSIALVGVFNVAKWLE